MNKPSQEQIDKFINALQLSIMSRIGNYEFNNDTLTIHVEKFKNDTKLKLWQKLISSQLNWISSDKMTIINLDSEQINALTNFLLLTRLESHLLKFLADSKQQDVISILKKLPWANEQRKNVEVKDLISAANYIFAKLKEKNMTLRELSELSGMTQASLHRFKNHQDIKLSTLIKMAKALGLVIKLE
jgi:DNA-binding Xre family transcriptional regulator